MDVRQTDGVARHEQRRRRSTLERQHADLPVASRIDVASTPPTHPSSRAERWLRVAITLSSFMGWRALANLLAAIPDSNDDFGVF
ncbi:MULTISPECIES: hypothetical protein [Paraburkholderia]|uniref:hypothetical protein n=1 Tax=Paraburkholderia TaxID=1822464 RepID=UPI0003A76919|nr:MULTISPECIES: hypothetical protein [Paraburkholderia]MDH6153266.1 chemotaxis response regulator CheB [Paraburkholderia sp. WSM4179]